jgi:hypothetical protein
MAYTMLSSSVDFMARDYPNTAYAASYGLNTAANSADQGKPPNQQKADNNTPASQPGDTVSSITPATSTNESQSAQGVYDISGSDAKLAGNGTTAGTTTTPRPPYKGLLFIRINSLGTAAQAKGEADSNARVWQELIGNLKIELSGNDEVPGFQVWQLNFGMATTESQLKTLLQIGKKYNLEPIFSSHGDPNNNEIKAIFGVDTYRIDFVSYANKLINSDYVSILNQWYSCDFTHGSRTPDYIFTNEARPYIIQRLNSINAK